MHCATTKAVRPQVSRHTSAMKATGQPICRDLRRARVPALVCPVTRWNSASTSASHSSWSSSGFSGDGFDTVTPPLLPVVLLQQSEHLGPHLRPAAVVETVRV